MIRLYFEGKFSPNQRVRLPRNEMKYLEEVRRAEGKIVLFNAEGEVAQVEFKDGEFKVISIEASEIPLHPIDVFIALPDNAVMAEIIRAVSELGLQRITFFMGERSQSAKKRVLALQESDRFQKIALESARQCGRGKPLEVKYKNEEFKEIVKTSSNRKNIFFDESSNVSVSFQAPLISSQDSLAGWIGCEGGWTEAERDTARRESFEIVHFETPILRVLTAATSASLWLVLQSKNAMTPNVKPR